MPNDQKNAGIGLKRAKMISSKLKESEIGLLQSICWELDFMVDDFISREVKRIVEKALMAGKISKIDLERLLKLFPQLEPMPSKFDDGEKIMADSDEDWPEWEDSKQAKQKRKMHALQQQLSNWLFTQYAVYQKQLSSKAVSKSSIRAVPIEKKVEKNI